jgi:hypothetical protein
MFPIVAQGLRLFADVSFFRGIKKEAVLNNI